MLMCDHLPDKENAAGHKRPCMRMERILLESGQDSSAHRPVALELPSVQAVSDYRKRPSARPLAKFAGSDCEIGANG